VLGAFSPAPNGKVWNHVTKTIVELEKKSATVKRFVSFTAEMPEGHKLKK
jgi:hypothetical protein